MLVVSEVSSNICAELSIRVLSFQENVHCQHTAYTKQQFQISLNICLYDCFVTLKVFSWILVPIRMCIPHPLCEHSGLCS